MTIIYTIYAGTSPIYQGTNYQYIKSLWDNVVSALSLANVKGNYSLKKGDELMFEFIGGTGQ